MRVIVALLIGCLAGCGLSPERYVLKRTKVECDYAMRCYEPAVLEFRSWTDEETCEADLAPEIAAQGVGCTFDNTAARQCIQELKAGPCPSATPPVVPPICEWVFTDCKDEPQDSEDMETGSVP